ncbi:MAG: META domain-containing protein [Sedimentitalea sp.]|nr:META domain-containing protein [Sedimentitalea sp.]
MFRFPHLALPALAVAAGLTALPALASSTGDEAGMITVTGQIAYRQRIALPPGNVATVTIQDVARADAKAPVIAETTVTDRQVPIPFEVQVAPEALEHPSRLALRATIHDAQGALLWTTDTHIPVDPGQPEIDLGMIELVQVAARTTAAEASYQCGDRTVSGRFEGDALTLTLDGTEYALVNVRSASGAKYETADGKVMFWEKGEDALLELDGTGLQDCTRIADTASRLTGAEWRVEDLNGAGVIDNAQTTLTFDADGSVYGSGGCNRYNGGFELDGDTLKIGPVAATQMACAEAVSNQEWTFFQLLDAPLTVSFSETGALILTADDGRAITARQ